MMGESNPNLVQTYPLTGSPLTEALCKVFSPWGTVKGVWVTDQSGIVAEFQGGLQLKFIPTIIGFGG